MSKRMFAFRKNASRIIPATALLVVIGWLLWPELQAGSRLGKVTGAELVHGLWIQAAWLVFFIIVSRLAFHFGVKPYSGFGG